MTQKHFIYIILNLTPSSAMFSANFYATVFLLKSGKSVLMLLMEVSKCKKIKIKIKIKNFKTFYESQTAIYLKEII